jgi:hypothetical protein
VLAYERGDWDALVAIAGGRDPKVHTLTDCYAEAVQWADGAEIE